MSTKIYEAYRIPKEKDILKELLKARDIAIDTVANDAAYLRMIHAMSIYNATRDYINDKNPYAKSVIKDHKDGKLDEFWIERMLQKNQTSLERGNFDAYFTCSIFYDDSYWYLKFFYNDGSFRKAATRIVEELEFEDYHYQNQVDPPKDIPYEDFYQRGEKWEELMQPYDNYRGGFEYIIFDSYEFKILISRYYFTGDKDIYKHLAYKFNDKFISDFSIYLDNNGTEEQKES